MIDIKGKNALITGSSRGVGQQIALGLAKLGCNLILHGRTFESNTKTLKLLEDYEINTYVVFGELSDEKEVNEIINQVESFNLQIDILYNNAAIMTPYNTNYWDHSWDEWMLSFKVNVMAMYSLCRAFIPKMIENNFGRVINTTSGITGEPELMPYGASKWAVDKLTDDLKVKLENTNVKINTLDPGWCKTDLGGPEADHDVTEVLPGALEPALIEESGPNGKMFSAINHKLNIN